MTMTVNSTWSLQQPSYRLRPIPAGPRTTFRLPRTLMEPGIALTRPPGILIRPAATSRLLQTITGHRAILARPPKLLERLATTVPGCCKPGREPGRSARRLWQIPRRTGTCHNLCPAAGSPLREPPAILARPLQTSWIWSPSQVAP